MMALNTLNSKGDRRENLINGISPYNSNRDFYMDSANKYIANFIENERLNLLDK